MLSEEAAHFTALHRARSNTVNTRASLDFEDTATSEVIATDSACFTGVLRCAAPQNVTEVMDGRRQRVSHRETFGLA